MDRQNKIVGIVGRKGSGKSTVFRQMLIRIQRLVIFNTMGEHNWTPDQLSDLDSLTTYLNDVADPKEKFQLSYTPLGDVQEEFDIVANEVFSVGNLTFGIEEMPMLTRSAGYMQPSLGRLFRLGRHRSLNLVWTAQRAAEVPRGVTGATDFFILFQQTEPADLDALEKRAGEEVVQQVEHLGLHDFITYDVINREIGDQHDFMAGEYKELFGKTATVEPEEIHVERKPIWEEEYS